MFPTLLDFGVHDLPLVGTTHLYLPTYGLLFASGTVLAWWWFMRRARTLGLKDETVFNLGFYSVLAGLVGAKVALVLVEWRLYLEHPEELLGTLRSAGVLMGGVILGAATFWWYCRRHDLPILPLADAAVAPVAVAQAIGRLGCFSAGCCYGVPSHGALAITFTDPAAHAQTGVPLGIPLVPTQLIQFANDLVLAGILALMWRRRVRPSGTTFWTYVLLYSLTRGTIEFWRGDSIRGVYFGGLVSTSQIVAVVAIVVAIVAIARLWRSRPESARP